MQIYYEDDQACLFDPESYVGKTCLEHSPQESLPARIACNKTAAGFYISAAQNVSGYS